MLAPAITRDPDALTIHAAAQLAAAAVLLQEGVEGSLGMSVVLLDHLIRPPQDTEQHLNIRQRTFQRYRTTSSYR